MAWYASQVEPKDKNSATALRPPRNSRASKTMTPPASPRFMPSRAASNGRQSDFESSMSDPNPSAVMRESESAPQTTAASALPSEIARHADSSASDELEQAAENVEHSPRAPIFFATSSAMEEHS